MSLVLFEKKDFVATVTLNEPDKLNAMSEKMGKEFQKLMRQIKKMKDVRVIVLKGSGRAFSAGGNLDMIEGFIQNSPNKNKETLKKFYNLFLEIRKLPQPVIAAINGHAVGAGFCLAMACDLKYSVPKAKMGANFAKLGLAPGMAGTYLITRFAGPVNAAEILMTGDLFDANKAKEYGLLNNVFSEKTFEKAVYSIAKRIADNAPLPVQQIKTGIQKAQTATLEKMFDYDAASQAKCLKTEDIKEGIRAIRNKRPPVFKGK